MPMANIREVLVTVNKAVVLLICHAFCAYSYCAVQ